MFDIPRYNNFINRGADSAISKKLTADVPFDIIDENNFVFYIKTEIGVKFLRFLKKDNFKLWNLLAKAARSVDNLGFKQKKYLFSKFNEFFISNYAYKTHVELTTPKDKDRYAHILHSAYGDKFLTLLSKEYPTLHKRLYDCNFEAFFLKDADQVLYFKLFNLFFKTNCKSIAVTNASPAMAKHIKQAKKKLPAAPSQAAPSQAAPSQAAPSRAARPAKPKKTKKHIESKLKAQLKSFLEIRKPSKLTQAEAENRFERQPQKATSFEMVGDFWGFYLLALNREDIQKPINLSLEYIKSVDELYSSEELKLIYTAIKYAIGDNFEFAQQNDAMFVIPDCKPGKFIMYDKSAFKKQGYNPDNIIIVHDKHTGKTLIYDKLQLINNARQYQTLYQNALASADLTAEEWNAALLSDAKLFKKTRAYLEADKMFKEKYGQGADIVLPALKFFLFGNYETEKKSRAGRFQAGRLTGLKAQITDILQYRVRKEKLEINERTHGVLITPSLYLMLDFVKGSKTLDNICKSISAAKTFNFKKAGSVKKITIDALNPDNAVLKQVKNGLLELAQNKSFADNFIDSFNNRVEEAGSVKALAIDATAGAIKGLYIDMPVTMIHCTINPFLGPLFFFNSTTPEGFNQLKKDLFRTMEEGGEGEIAAYISFNLQMGVGMVRHGAHTALEGLKGAKKLVLKLTKEKIEVEIDGKEFNLAQEELNKLIKDLEESGIKPSKIKITKKIKKKSKRAKVKNGKTPPSASSAPSDGAPPSGAPPSGAPHGKASSVGGKIDAPERKALEPEKSARLQNNGMEKGGKDTSGSNKIDDAKSVKTAEQIETENKLAQTIDKINTLSIPEEKEIDAFFKCMVEFKDLYNHITQLLKSENLTEKQKETLSAAKEKLTEELYPGLLRRVKQFTEKDIFDSFYSDAPREVRQAYEDIPKDDRIPEGSDENEKLLSFRHEHDFMTPAGFANAIAHAHTSEMSKQLNSKISEFASEFDNVFRSPAPSKSAVNSFGNNARLKIQEIINIAENLKESLPDGLQHYLRRVVILMKYLLEDLQDFEPLTKDNIQKDKININLYCFTEELADLHYSGKKINFVISETLKNLNISANIRFIRFILKNLINDSIREKGDASNTITISAEEKNGKKFLIFEDTAGGVPYELKEKIFERGFSARKSTGFGLWQIRDFLRAYGWEIKECGKPGVGVKFVMDMTADVGADGPSALFDIAQCKSSGQAVRPAEEHPSARQTSEPEKTQNLKSGTPDPDSVLIKALGTEVTETLKIAYPDIEHLDKYITYICKISNQISDLLTMDGIKADETKTNDLLNIRALLITDFIDFMSENSAYFNKKSAVEIQKALNDIEKIYRLGILDNEAKTKLNLIKARLEEIRDSKDKKSSSPKSQDKGGAPHQTVQGGGAPPSGSDKPNLLQRAKDNLNTAASAIARGLGLTPQPVTADGPVALVADNGARAPEVPKRPEKSTQMQMASASDGATALTKDAKYKIENLVCILLDDRPELCFKRAAAAFDLGEIGAEAKKVIPDFIKILENKNEDMYYWVIRAKTAEALVKIDPERREPLIKILEDNSDDLNVRIRAACALGDMGNRAEDATDAFIKVLENKKEDWSLRKIAAWALGNVGNKTEKSITVLNDVLNEPDIKSGLRKEASLTLEKISSNRKNEYKAQAAEIEPIIQRNEEKAQDPPTPTQKASPGKQPPGDLYRESKNATTTKEKIRIADKCFETEEYGLACLLYWQAGADIYIFGKGERIKELGDVLEKLRKASEKANNATLSRYYNDIKDYYERLKFKKAELKNRALKEAKDKISAELDVYKNQTDISAEFLEKYYNKCEAVIDGINVDTASESREFIDAVFKSVITVWLEYVKDILRKTKKINNPPELCRQSSSIFFSLVQDYIISGKAETSRLYNKVKEDALNLYELYKKGQLDKNECGDEVLAAFESLKGGKISAENSHLAIASILAAIFEDCYLKRFTGYSDSKNGKGIYKDGQVKRIFMEFVDEIIKEREIKIDMPGEETSAPKTKANGAPPPPEGGIKSAWKKFTDGLKNILPSAALITPGGTRIAVPIPQDKARPATRLQSTGEFESIFDREDEIIRPGAGLLTAKIEHDADKSKETETGKADKPEETELIKKFDGAALYNDLIGMISIADKALLSRGGKMLFQAADFYHIIGLKIIAELLPNSAIKIHGVDMPAAIELQEILVHLDYIYGQLKGNKNKKACKRYHLEISWKQQAWLNPPPREDKKSGFSLFPERKYPASPIEEELEPYKYEKSTTENLLSYYGAWKSLNITVDMLLANKHNSEKSRSMKRELIEYSKDLLLKLDREYYPEELRNAARYIFKTLLNHYFPGGQISQETLKNYSLVRAYKELTDSRSGITILDMFDEYAEYPDNVSRWAELMDNLIIALTRPDDNNSGEPAVLPPTAPKAPSGPAEKPDTPKPADKQVSPETFEKAQDGWLNAFDVFFPNDPAKHFAPEQPKDALNRNGYGPDFKRIKPEGMTIDTKPPIDPFDPPRPGERAGFAQAKDGMFPSDNAKDAVDLYKNVRNEAEAEDLFFLENMYLTPDGFPEVVKALKSPNIFARRAAAHALYNAHPTNNLIEDALIKTISINNEQDTRLLFLAISALFRIAMNKDCVSAKKIIITIAKKLKYFPLEIRVHNKTSLNSIVEMLKEKDDFPNINDSDRQKIIEIIKIVLSAD